jgi:hypothetical protein
VIKLAILESEVWVGLSSKTIWHYENLGYQIPRIKNKWGKIQYKQGEKLKVKIEHLQKGSMVEVTKICDDCGKYIKNQPYKAVIHHREKTDGKDRCNECGAKYNGNMRKVNIPYVKTLKFYALNNDAIYLLREFSGKNIKSPTEINYSTEDIYLWNCPDCNSEYEMKVVVRTYHKSNCPYCSGSRVNDTNSLATVFPEIAKEWHPKLNGQLSPHNVTYGSKVTVWWRCELEHEWESSINRRTNMNSGCPVCNESKGERKIRKWLEDNTKEYISQKEFNGLIGIGGGNLSYDFYLPSNNLLIEFQGQFHDGLSDYTKINLERQKEHDNRKLEYAKTYNIKLLEIWYWDYENIEQILENALNGRETVVNETTI